MNSDSANRLASADCDVDDCDVAGGASRPATKTPIVPIATNTPAAISWDFLTAIASHRHEERHNRPVRQLVRIGLPAVVVLLVGMAVSGVLTPPRYPGLPETPFLTLVLTPIGRAALFTSGTFGVGLILVGGLLSREPRMLRLAARVSANRSASWTSV